MSKLVKVWDGTATSNGGSGGSGVIIVRYTRSQVGG